jgi:hypothetical protein
VSAADDALEPTVARPDEHGSADLIAVDSLANSLMSATGTTNVIGTVADDGDEPSVDLAQVPAAPAVPEFPGLPVEPPPGVPADLHARYRAMEFAVRNRENRWLTAEETALLNEYAQAGVNGHVKATAARTQTAESMLTALMRVDRLHGPWILDETVRSGNLSREALQGVLCHVWEMADHPEYDLDRRRWLSLFERTGFLHNDAPGIRPDKTQVLYRGSTPHRRLGMSWTEDPDLAQWFARTWRPNNGKPTHVYVAKVAPHRLLARIDEGREGEVQWVVDSRGLKVARADQ